MKNHFHLFARIRACEELNELWKESGGVLDANKIILKTSKAFSNFFSSYTQSFNKVYDRMGSLFVPSMKTEYVEGAEAFKRVVRYIHANPVRHGFVPRLEMWKHSSYDILLSNEETKLERDHVLEIFGGRDKFIEYHVNPD